jgi:wyosine [tRNA(Phe)-imidazoG37] synthetase (radical SAM superfamily)
MAAKSSSGKALQQAFQNHSRNWRSFRYVYPVVSRRAAGLSIGINLNPDMACNFDCVYCQVDRTQPATLREVDLAVVEQELRSLLELGRAIFDEPEFAEIPAEFKQLRDFAFSGDGEPTAASVFPEACRLVAGLRDAYKLEDTRIVVITDACFLTRSHVEAALDELYLHGGEVWAKLDAGTEAYFKQVARASHSLDHVLGEIKAAALRHPLVIQSLFMRLHDQPPPAEEVAAYVQRLGEVIAAGGKIKLVQVYTVARQTAESYVSRLSEEALNTIAEAVRGIGLAAAVYR